MNLSKTVAMIESILFVAGDPISIDELRSTLGIGRNEMDEALEYMKKELDKECRGICLNQFDDFIQLVTKEENYDLIQKFIEPRRKSILTKAAIETVSIIAYRQPITRAEIEQIRGVKCEKAIMTLMDKGLIEESGRLECIGRPILYSTTPEFLRYFSLKSVRELPDYNKLGGKTND